jgi:UDP-N-acetylglucosamine:LPS N-acetylglucosamine transferase
MRVGHSRRKKVLAVASGGGHWVQLLRLQSAFESHDVTFVSVAQSYSSEVAGNTFHCINDSTRWNKLGLIRTFVRLFWIISRQVPDVIISTGAAPGYIALLIGRIFGCRTIWVDSIANVEQISLSGAKVGRYADLWLTQWPELARPDGPRYMGAVI